MHLTLVLVALSSLAAAPAAGICDIPRRFHAIATLPEASGVAVSSTPGLLWSINDSAEPTIVALDATGQVKARVAITGAMVRDWEDISAGPCNGKRCLYIADIGDNQSERHAVTLYRVAEPPATAAATAPAEVFTATYPDGPHDAEAVFVTGAGDVYLITKSSAKRSALYRFPSRMKTGSPMRLERVASIPHPSVTDAETSLDGEWVAVRTNRDLFFYRSSDIVAGKPAAVHVDLMRLGEPQGEGVAVGQGGIVYLVGEGGRGRAPGTVAAMTCRLPNS
jgi:hypothetical protein